MGETFELQLQLPEGMKASLDVPARGRELGVFVDGKAVKASLVGDRLLVAEPVNGTVSVEVR